MNNFLSLDSCAPMARRSLRAPDIFLQTDGHSGELLQKPEGNKRQQLPSFTALAKSNELSTSEEVQIDDGTL
jgi:hypothetical protein